MAVSIGQPLIRMAQVAAGLALLRTLSASPTALRAPASARRRFPDPRTPAENREVAGPTQLSWTEIVKAVVADVSRHRIMALAAEMTFYSLLALFPALAALVSLYGLFFDPAAIQSQMNGLRGVLPGGGMDIIGSEIKSLAATPNQSLSLGFAVGLVVALWSANAGVKSVFDALNFVYEETEKRSFIKLNLVTLAVTFSMLIVMILALAAMVAVPIALSFINTGVWGLIISIARWPVLLIIVGLILAVLYRFGPCRPAPRWRWITPGSAFASVVWLGASMLFSWYVANFGSYNKTYGSLGAAVGFMTWMWISGMIILIGADIDAQTERQAHQKGAKTT